MFKNVVTYFIKKKKPTSEAMKNKGCPRFVSSQGIAESIMWICMKF
jgi:hypothetical protein